MVTYGLSWHQHHPNTYRYLTVFFLGGACRDVPYVIWFVVFGGVLLSLCHSVRVQEKTTLPPPPNSGSLRNMCAWQRHGVSCEGKYLFSIPWSGAVWGGGGRIYIGAFAEHSPSQAAPWGQVIDDEWLSIIYSCSERTYHGQLPPYHLPNGKIRNLGIELPMVTAIRTSGHTRGW